MFRLSIFTPLLAASLFISAASRSTTSAADPVMAAGVDQSPIAIVADRAFPKILIDRPVTLTNAGDGSNRIFVAGQLGKIYSFVSKQDVAEPDLFMDIEDRVTYKENENEEGLLGLAFHPKFKDNGEFFIYYTGRTEPNLSVISRFKSTADHKQGDPASEQVLMTIKQPYWNHNGGTLEFGKDGYLYIALGDGGKRDDPLQSAQDLTTLLGKVLRIDIDNKSPGMPYAIPGDNPFVKVPGARPEIYARGFRNPWRISFDRATGDLWCADVGQDLWEEISFIKKGGNNGWSVRESAHKFGPKGVNANEQMTEPVWEYPHDERYGKSITGGQVYRGKLLPELTGYYLYGDYVTGKLWALKVDSKTGKATENRVIEWSNGANLPVVTFGEDEAGEVYFTSVTSGGRIYHFRKK
jgi:quinoprotein glucose dehydrogenase